MDSELFGFILSTLGELCIGYSVLRVHNQVSKDRRIGSNVLGEMKKERKLAFLGIILIILGFILQSFSRFSHLLFLK